ncbi:ABC transporter permease [Rhizobium sp. 1399]|jgi:sulfonate transport system permease protein|uniref:ABC transporter permease n=1 Tax=Rhizobium sp. 1399 TaxID=2817758 RepID=UPI0028650DEA|nr:ABC transporter permease [Rhizobium sp. 1399]MDR6665499.1 sulfonate transport system permease protein [Rhizobium sp. 1399]
MALLTSLSEGQPALPGSGVSDPRPVTGLERIVPAGKQKTASLPRGFGKSLGPAALVVAWWLATRYGWISEDLFPGPATLWATLLDMITGGDLSEALLLSLQRVVIGFCFGFVIGVGLAVISGLLRLGEDLVDAPMQMARTLPWAGLVPLLIIWLGIDETPKITLVAFAVTFPLYINTFAGIRNVDKTLIEAARTLSFGRTALIFQVILPGALPNLLVGLRYSLGSAWLALVFAETVNAQGGLGYLITHAREVYRVDIIILCLVIYALLGLSADLIVRLLERVLLRWRQSFDGA